MSANEGLELKIWGKKKVRKKKWMKAEGWG